jgi:hypothetical protein
MERNNDDLSSTGGLAGSTGGSANAGNTGAGSSGTGSFGNSGDLSGTSGYGSVGGSVGSSAGTTGNVGNIGTTTGAGMATSEESAGLRDRARNIVGNAGERLADVGSTVRERAGTAKSSLADILESGAERLRGSRESVGVDGSMALTSDGRMAPVNDRLASGMQSAANLLRDTDFDGVKSGIERQVRENPGRSLLIAVGVGYFLGKALRR